ncbi:MAG: hypothetical protein ACK5GN_07940, partial [Pseudomonadota bacterium]
VQKSVPVKLARLLLDITIGCCFDSHPRIDSVLQNSGFRYGLLENAIYVSQVSSSLRLALKGMGIQHLRRYRAPITPFLD